MLLKSKVATLSRFLSVPERSFNGYATASPRPSHTLSGAEQRNTPYNVNCVFIEICLEPCLKIRLPV